MTAKGVFGAWVWMCVGIGCARIEEVGVGCIGLCCVRVWRDGVACVWFGYAMEGCVWLGVVGMVFVRAACVCDLKPGSLFIGSICTLLLPEKKHPPCSG